jgi:hypothetical protein
MVAVRLNGWQRLGILASLAWVIAGPLFIVEHVEKSALKHFSRTYSYCMDANSTDSQKCLDQAERAYDAWFNPVAAPGYGRWAARAFVPVVFAWVLVFVLVYLVRWIITRSFSGTRW